MSKITVTNIITKLVVQFVETPKQTNRQSNNKGASTYNTIETPLYVGVGLYVYHSARSKKLVKFLSDLNVSISYDKVIDIKKDIAANIIEKSKEHDNVFVPLSLVNSEPMIFVIDKADSKINKRKGSASWNCDCCLPITAAESNKGTNFSSLVLKIPSQ